MTSTTARPNRKNLAQAVLTVQEVERLSPGLVRITAGGDGYDAFTDNEFTDRYVKILFADPAHGLVPPYDLAALREHEPEKLPTRRTYTVRASDPEARRLTIDFVVHGSEGIAGPWAEQAKPGDTIVLSGAGGKYSPEPDANWHLLIADLAALPAVSSALEAMPQHARGHLFLSVADSDDRVLPPVPAGVTVHWADTDEELLTALAGFDWPKGTPQVFAHGERETIKKVRRVLAEREIPRETISISAYWARGRAEDQFQAEKREPIGQIE